MHSQSGVVAGTGVLSFTGLTQLALDVGFTGLHLQGRWRPLERSFSVEPDGPRSTDGSVQTRARADGTLTSSSKGRKQRGGGG